jgi:hypothetical protein
MFREIDMILAIVEFKTPEAIPPEMRSAIALRSAPKFRTVPGLERKHYWFAPDGRTAGGAYLWKSRADAERWWTPEYLDKLAKEYGAVPTISYLECPVVVDNVVGKVFTDAAAEATV